jgi:hypothetical protein
MIKQTLALILGISITYLPSLSLAEEPYFGVGAVSHQVKQDTGKANNDFDVKPTGYRFTVGSRIAKNWIAEVYYIKSADSDSVTYETSDPTTFDIEYESIFGASINYALISGPFTFYAGPNLTVANLNATVDTTKSPTLTTEEVMVQNNRGDYNSRYSLGGGVGIDLTIYKNFSININAQSYLIDSDQIGIGYAAELRYHL